EADPDTAAAGTLAQISVFVQAGPVPLQAPAPPVWFTKSESLEVAEPKFTWSVVLDWFGETGQVPDWQKWLPRSWMTVPLVALLGVLVRIRVKTRKLVDWDLLTGA